MSSITDLLEPVAAAGYNAPGGFVQGTVSENNNKKFPGMVKVEFTSWEQGKNISEWLPLLHAYAGKDHGLYSVPDIGDLVLVGFIGPGLEQPFVMGSFYLPGASIPGDQFADKNINRYLKTIGGIEATLSDEKDKHRVEVKTPKELQITMNDGDEAIVVGDRNKKNVVNIDSKNGEISIKADKKLSVKVGKCELTMNGKSGAITIKCDRLNIEAGKTATIKSKSNMTVEGGMVKVDGKQKLTLKGAAMCEISGGMVKIN